MLAASDLLNESQQHSWSPHGNILCIYGDLAYPLRPELQSTFKDAAITPMQAAWNRSISSVRVSVEWIFGDIMNFFKFLDSKKNLKIQLSAVGKMYIICTLLQNASPCLYGSTTSEFFGLDPLKIDEYFV